MRIIEDLIEDKRLKNEKELEIILKIARRNIILCFLTGTLVICGLLKLDEKTRNEDAKIINNILDCYETDYENMVSYNNIESTALADYIVSSDNPDLALYSFYDTFYKDNPDLVNETFKIIEFNYNGANINNLSYDNYLKICGFKSNEEYQTDVKKEILSDYNNDREIELDNLNLKVKKLTLNKKEQ